MRYVHQSCLKIWFTTSNQKSCSVCKHRYVTQTKLKPMMKWTFPSLSKLEYTTTIVRAIHFISVLVISLVLITGSRISYEVVKCLVVSISSLCYAEWKFYRYGSLPLSFIVKKFRAQNSDLIFHNAPIWGLASKRHQVNDSEEKIWINTSRMEIYQARTETLGLTNLRKEILTTDLSIEM